MSSTLPFTWPIEKADPIAVVVVIDKLLDFSVTMARELGPNGLAHRLVGEAEHVERYLVGRQPIAFPGDHEEGDDAATIANRTRRLKLYDLQQKLDPILEVAMESVYPPHIRNMMVVRNSLKHLTLAEQITFLRANFRLTKENLKTLKDNVSLPYTIGTKIETHVAEQREAIAQLALAQQPMPTMDATDAMMKAYTSTPTSAQDFAPCISEFLKDHGALVDQTPAHFGAHIIKYVNERLVHHQAVNEAQRATMRVAKSATESQPMTSADQMELLALRAEKAAANMKPAGKPTAKPSAAQAPVAPRAPRQLAAGAPPFYCWSHGNDFTGTSPHYSHENCKAKKTGHKKAATFANQMGGTPA